MSLAEAVEPSIKTDREREIAEAVRWLVDRYGAERVERQLLYALSICRRLKHATDGDADE